MNLFHRPVSAIPTTPLAAVVLGLVLAAAPLFDRTAGWVVVLFFAACATRLLMNRRGRRLPSLPVKVVLFGLGGAGIMATYGTALGIEPGLSILLLLVSLKLLETNTVRDFLVVALLGYFLALCDLFFSQAFLLWLYVAGNFTLLTAALVHFLRGDGTTRFRTSARLSAVLLLQALPIVVLLFVFFPRTQQPFVMQFAQPQLGTGGMSDSLSPGSIAALALGTEIVFHASFPDGNAPSMSVMYWRAGVLWQGDGLHWERGASTVRSRPQTRLGGAGIRQRIVLQPHGARWLFALDRPTDRPVSGAHLEPGGFLQSNRPVLKRMQYEVISRPENREATLSADQRAAALRQPHRVSLHVQNLVNLWRAANPGDRELVDAALHYFRDERFTYALEPGTYSPENELDEFLFERRAGFCEHYAAAFATLMRIAGIPSRVVIGYHGGEDNALGKYVIVRQSDAHAWCEVWLKGVGWQRVDPTDMIAPDRLTSGFASYLETRALASTTVPASAAATGWREIRRELRLAWDNVNFQWDLLVLGFDEEHQHSFIGALGFGDLAWVETLLGVAAGIAVLLSALGLWQRRPGPPPGDAAARSYAEFGRILAAAGLPREPWEGPEHFGERAAARFPAQAGAIRTVTALYTRLRYAPQAPPPADLARAVRALGKVSSAS